MIQRWECYPLSHAVAAGDLAVLQTAFLLLIEQAERENFNMEMHRVYKNVEKTCKPDSTVLKFRETFQKPKLGLVVSLF